MRGYGLAAATAACMVSGTAMAAPTPTYVFTPGVYSNTAASAGIFEGFDGATGGFTARTNGFANESSTGSATVYPGSENVTGTAVNPDGGTDNYLAVGGAGAAGTFTVDFTKGGSIASAVQYFSFALGSLDNYNTLTLNFAGGSSIFLSGKGIITGDPTQNTPSGTAAASYSNGSVTGRLNIYANGGSSLNSVVFGSSQAAFEIDSLAAATPEPGTWAMMILGFGMVGSAFRLRRRKATIAFA